jgi:3-oxoacyl-[acyl-carrier-protein] synthase-1
MALKNDRSGIRLHQIDEFSVAPFYSSLFPRELRFPGTPSGFTRFEELIAASISRALESETISLKDPETVLILSTTKGNISLIEKQPISKDLEERIAIAHSAELLSAYFGYHSNPLIISNACISGLLALLTGYRLIQSGKYMHAVVSGCDIITRFILSGFQSFMAVSPNPCKPFDAGRDGITLGEGAATIILSADEKFGSRISLCGGAVSNDANHISGPSRTGEELAAAVSMALTFSNIRADMVDMISAHGTATIYNDEMEARAIALNNLENVPVNSLKGNYGHTLGAAGLIESVMTIHSLLENLMLPTKNFQKIGVSRPVRVSQYPASFPMSVALKTASGFGGCNAALVFKKNG